VTVPLRREAHVEILDGAGALARGLLAAPLEVRAKDDHSPVTQVDREVDAFLHRELRLLLPGSGWLSEETADDRARLGRDLTWIVDPIDGTKELVAGRAEIAVSIGLVRSGRPVAAAVGNPATGERGTWVEGGVPVFEKLAARPGPSSLAQAEAIVSRTETEEGALSDLGALVASLRPVGSVAYKLLRVASGVDALTFSVRPKSEWDVCGGVGLLEAAGRAYLRLDGGQNVFNRPDTTIRTGAVAGPADLAGALREALVARIGAAYRPR